MGESIAEVAAGLTKAQRSAIDWLASGNVAASDAFHGHSKEQPRRPTLTRLTALGLAELDLFNSAWTVTATPLGIAVRNHLISQGADHDR